jgi:hypothetical protein
MTDPGIVVLYFLYVPYLAAAPEAHMNPVEACPLPSTRVTVPLRVPASDLVCEELTKRVYHLARGIANASVDDGGTCLTFDAPAELSAELSARAADLSARVERALRGVARSVTFRSAAAHSPRFRGDGTEPGVHRLGSGQVALSGLSLALFEYFDRTFARLGASFRASPLRPPALIPVETLARCGYLSSFPHLVNFASHLPDDASVVDEFRSRHRDRAALDERAAAEMETPVAGLSPAVCYHAYGLHAGGVLPAAGVTYGLCGRCFRHEGGNVGGLRRLWEFTLREVVFLGTSAQTRRRRARAVELIAALLDRMEIAAEIRTASDPFFAAPDDALPDDALWKTSFQLRSDTKLEVAALLPDGDRLAVASINQHADFFGRAFGITLTTGDPMHSACVGFGLERWVHVFLAQHGTDVAGWPASIRAAPELARWT